MASSLDSAIRKDISFKPHLVYSLLTFFRNCWSFTVDCFGRESVLVVATLPHVCCAETERKYVYFWLCINCYQWFVFMHDSPVVGSCLVLQLYNISTVKLPVRYCIWHWSTHRHDGHIIAKKNVHYLQAKKWIFCDPVFLSLSIPQVEYSVDLLSRLEFTPDSPTSIVENSIQQLASHIPMSVFKFYLYRILASSLASSSEEPVHSVMLYFKKSQVCGLRRGEGG